MGEGETISLTPNDLMAIKELQNWMAKIDDGVNVCQLSIPGTHESHSVFRNIVPPIMDSKVAEAPATVPDIVKAYSATQYLDVVAQLQAGVRFLDFQVNEDLNMQHGEVGLTDNLTTVLEGVRSFLVDKDHPRETVIISIKQGDHSRLPVKQTLHKSVQDIWGRFEWYTGNEWPILGKVRGKAILFRRFDTDDGGPFGIDGNGFGGERHSLGNIGKWDLQEQQDVTQSNYKNDTWEHTWKHLEQARNATDTDVMYFTGLVKSRWPDILPEVLKLVSESHISPEWYSFQLNQNLMQELGKSRTDIQNPQSRRLGVIILDHILGRECVKIIAKNFEQVIREGGEYHAKGWNAPEEVARFENGVNIQFQDDGHLVVYQDINGSNTVLWALREMSSLGGQHLMFWHGNWLSMHHDGPQYWTTTETSETSRLRFISGPPYVMIDTSSIDHGEILYCTIPTNVLSSKNYGSFTEVR